MSTKITFDPVPSLSEELAIDKKRIQAVLQLLQEGNTVPFIARYRKEKTGELDEVQIRAIEERNTYLTELNERRQTILHSIEEQGKLTDELRQAVLSAVTKSQLEDLYLPYKPKRRTRATIAREKGLQPLAELILAQQTQGDPLAEAQAYVSEEKGVQDVQAALAGARDIVAENISEQAPVRAWVRERFFQLGQLSVEVVPQKQDQATKFQQYYDYREAVANMPSHRFLAIRRGEREDVLKATVQVEEDPILSHIEAMVGLNAQSPYRQELSLAVKDAFGRLIAPSVENDVRVDLKLRADQEAVEVFAANLRNLLMASPLGGKPVLGIDPGVRTGCKVVMVDHTGKFIENTVIYISGSAHQTKEAEQKVLQMIARNKPVAVAVGNGTGGRETEAFVRRVMTQYEADQKTIVVQVNEAGASVYSASDIAREEFPDQDLTVRGAVSIARRLQDPLAELVKIDPKAIGVGQYQHDVNQPMLARKLDEVVESCVNQVGVELNTASAPLLARVSGIGPKMAKRIVSHREEKGAFSSRQQILKVAGLGPKTFEQAAGFLRVHGASHPLDASAVHPERYALVERIAEDLNVDLAELVGKPQLRSEIQLEKYVSDDVGLPTLRDILAELEKPGRDPRSSFDPVQFRDDVNDINDLEVGMLLEGVVTNVTAFGAFVDIGVHRDGLVHISQLSDQFVNDPHKVVKVGDRLRVRVLEVEIERDRISLSARSNPAPKKQAQTPGRQEPNRKISPKKSPRQHKPQGDAKAELTHNPFAQALKKK